MRTEGVVKDLEVCVEENRLHEKYRKFVGYQSMANTLERTIEKRFASEVKGILKMLRDHDESACHRMWECKKELCLSGSTVDFWKSVRNAGQTFAR